MEALASNYHYSMCVLSSFSHVRLFVTLCTIAHQAPLSMGFPSQGYWSGLPFPSLGDLADSGIEPASPVSPALAGRFSIAEPSGEPVNQNYRYSKNR